MKRAAWDLRNRLDFVLRNALSWGRPLSPGAPLSETDRRYQEELKEFLAMFPWPELTRRMPWDRELNVADVGARNFALAPVIDDLLAQQGLDAHVYGIELDAFRRYRDFRTRADYGRHFARLARKATFLPGDFLQWTTECDLLLLLNPFVTEDPLLSWGLPRAALKPDALFRHAFELLESRRGCLILSSPNPEEWRISRGLALTAGFQARKEVTWHPRDTSLQKRTRYGGFFSIEEI